MQKNNIFPYIIKGLRLFLVFFFGGGKVLIINKLKKINLLQIHCSFGIGG